MNQITLIGNVGQDPTIRTARDKKVAQFSLATSYGQGETRATDWHTIVAWSPRAEIIEKHVRKGACVAVQGSLHYRSFDSKNGERVNVAEVLCTNVVLLDKPEGRVKAAPAIDDLPEGDNVF